MSIWPDEYSMSSDGVTQSLLAAAAVCPVKAALMADRWYSPSIVKSTAFGSLCHDILETVYGDVYTGTYEDIRDAVNTAIDAHLTKNRDELYEVLGAEEWESVATKAYDVMVAYIDHYLDDWQKNKYTGLEHLAECRFGDWRLRGKLDGIFTAKDGTRWLLEHKTMSRIDEDSLWLRVSFDSQVQFYLLMYELATGERLDGVIYNVIRNPSHKKRESLQADLAKRPEHFFIRGEVKFTDSDRERFKHDLEAQLMELDMRVSGLLPTWRNTTACDKPYRCTFLGWCATNNIEGLRQNDTLFPELQ